MLLRLGRPFHVEDDLVDAADEIIVTGVDRNGHGNARRRANERLPDAARERAHVRIKAVGLQFHENSDETDDGAEQPQ